MHAYLGASPGVSAGELRGLGTGDTIEVYRSAFERPDWAAYWVAIGVAVRQGADLRIRD